MLLNPSEITDLIGPVTSNRFIANTLRKQPQGSVYIPPRVTTGLPPLRLNENSTIIQAQIEVGHLGSEAVQRRIQELYGKVI